MVYSQAPQGGRFHSSEEFEAHCREEEKKIIKSYEEFRGKGHEWCWCLVGNIVEEHVYGEEKETKRGTKQFSPGTKVYLAPAQWGDAYEQVIVIGIARGSRKYIEVVTHREYIEKYRMQRVYKPAVLKRIVNSKQWWWGDLDFDRERIIGYLDFLNPEEAEKERENEATGGNIYGMDKFRLIGAKASVISLRYYLRNHILNMPIIRTKKIRTSMRQSAPVNR